jgi:Tfp pilus assembly protein PilN
MPKTNINLVPRELIQERKFKSARKNFLYVGLGIILLSIVSVGVIYSLLISQKSYIKGLDEDKDKLVADIVALKTTEEQILVLGIRAELIGNVMSKRSNYSNLLEELKQVVPTQVDVSSLSVEGETIRLQGKANNYNELTKFTRSLKQKEKNKVFVDAEISNISLNGEDGTVTYNINAYISAQGLINPAFIMPIKAPTDATPPSTDLPTDINGTN